MVKQLAGGEPDVPGEGERPRRRIPEATVARLPLYLRSLFEAAEAKTATVSSERLAEMAGVNAAKVRKDLSYLGSYGTRGVGYDVEYLLFQISRELGLTQDWPVVIVGIGNLGHALANYKGFSERGFRVAALVDSDLAQRGEAVAAQKAAALVACGADVHVVAEQIGPDVRALPVTWEERSYSLGEVSAYRLAVAATDSPSTNKTVYDDGEAAGVWVNSADDP